MKNIEILALERVKDITDKIDKKITTLSITIGLNKETIDNEKHLYPIAQESREIRRWIEAILEDNEDS